MDERVGPKNACFELSGNVLPNLPIASRVTHSAVGAKSQLRQIRFGLCGLRRICVRKTTYGFLSIGRFHLARPRTVDATWPHYDGR